MITAEEKQKIIDNEHLKILSIFHMVLGVFGFPISGFLMLYSVMFGVRGFVEDSEDMGPEFGLVMGGIFGFLALATSIWAILMIISGVKMRKKQWRIFSMILPLPGLMTFGFSAVLAILNMIVLLRPSVKTLYETDKIQSV